MKVGIQLPEVERVVRWPELQAMAIAVESGGFDSIWVGDHLLYRTRVGTRGPWEAWTQLAAIAAVTQRVELGPLVAALPFHEPAMLAKMASTVDEISGGRLVFGVGAGWNQDEFAAFGIPFDRRVSRFAEAFEIIRRLMAGDEVSWEGEYYHLDRCVLLPGSDRQGAPPFMVGSNRPRMLPITLPHASSWNSWFTDFQNDPDRLPDLLARIDEACVLAGRDPVSLERTVALFVGLEEGSGRRGTEVPPVSGSDEHVADTLHRVASTGIGHVQLVLDPITLDSIDRMTAILDLYRSRYP
jgi:alkanesulfonate monooxygenase SsuD/methylene tetrahydromethanopterin reductase-like flavin-dependent oxidoreductase (luciferase family)